MGLFSSSSSKKTSNSTNKNYVFNNIDYRSDADGEGGMAGNLNINLADSTLNAPINYSVSQTDQGAVEAGLGIALASLDAIEETYKVGQQTQMSAIDKSINLATSAAMDDGAETVGTLIKWGGAALVVIVIVATIGKGRK